MNAYVYNTETMEIVAVISGDNHKEIDLAFNYDPDYYGMVFEVTPDLSWSKNIEEIQA